MIETRKIHPFEIPAIVNTYSSVLEIGCGTGQFLQATSCPVKVCIEGCVDLVHANLENFNRSNIKVYTMDILDMDKKFVIGTFDCVMAIDIIEHFEMEDALHVLKMCEEVAKHAVLCFIPVGNHPQNHDPRGYDNPLNDHKSTWYPENMEALGYTVFFDPDFHHEPGKDSGAMLAYKFLK